MFIWLLISVLCFFLFRRFTQKIEIRNYGNWQDFKMALWGWGLVAIIALVPIVNILGLLGFEIFCIADSRCSYGDTRFKEGKNHWISKFLDFMSKEY